MESRSGLEGLRRTAGKQPGPLGGERRRVQGANSGGHRRAGAGARRDLGRRGRGAGAQLLGGGAAEGVGAALRLAGLDPAAAERHEEVHDRRPGAPPRVVPVRPADDAARAPRARRLRRARDGARARQLPARQRDAPRPRPPPALPRRAREQRSLRGGGARGRRAPPPRVLAPPGRVVRRARPAQRRGQLLVPGPLARDASLPHAARERLHQLHPDACRGVSRPLPVSSPGLLRRGDS